MSKRKQITKLSIFLRNTALFALQKHPTGKKQLAARTLAANTTNKTYSKKQAVQQLHILYKPLFPTGHSCRCGGHSATIKSMPRASTASRFFCEMPESVIIMSMSSILHILAKPLRPNFDESASTIVFCADSIMLRFNSASRMSVVVKPYSKSIPSTPI